VSGPIENIRVLDMSRVFAGPWAGQLLGDLGAEVIKVERPEGGDDTRTWGPPFVPDAEGRETRETGYFLCVNRGKKSLTVNLSDPKGQQIVRELAAQSDVLLENFKPGTLARFGLGWEDLKSVNPRLVYCSITGFGQDGPYRDRPAYDFVIQAMGGLMSFTGEREDRPGGGPMKVGVAIVDLITGLYATVAVQAALAARQRTGTGQYIDISMLDVCTGSLANQAQNYLLTGKVPRPAGNDHPNIVPQGVVATRDGRLTLVVGNDGQFASFCGVIGRPDLPGDPRFATNSQRVAYRDALDDEIAPIMRTRGASEWAAALNAAGVPCGPINDMAQVFSDPHVLARGMLFSMEHAACGPIPQVANPIRFSETPIRYGSPPPVLGQHSDEVLSDILGLSPADIADLRSSGAIGSAAETVAAPDHSQVKA
jgi:crotonobetainyl-CoA:carnitine CoA-transferase CaiB-like acyl-CoA transferase